MALYCNPSTFLLVVQNLTTPPFNPQYDKNGRLIVVDVKKDIGKPLPDLSRMAYYMEKDVRLVTFFLVILKPGFIFCNLCEICLP